MNFEFSKRQWHIFLACFICYVAAYIGRLNFSAALKGLTASLSLTDAQGGLIQTAFALVYAAGQLVNGSIVDRLSARTHITIGLLLSSLFNILFGLVNSYWLLVALWALNGASQSMLWTPIVKLMATWFRGRRRGKVSFGMSIALIAGNLSAWALSGWMASSVNWRFSFIIPGAIVGIGSLAALLMVKDNPEPGEDLGEEESEEKAISAANQTAMPVGTMMRTTGLAMLLGCCICNGFIRDGIITWAPTIIAEMNQGTDIPGTLVSLIIPLLNLVGILMATRFFHLFHDDTRKCLSSLMALTAGLTLLLSPASTNVISCALMLGLSCSATYGINPTLTTLIPMEYEKAGRVSLAAGMIDSFIYLGSSLAGVVTGAVSDAQGWRVVFLLWLAVAILGTTFSALSIRGGRRLASMGIT